MSPKVRLAEIFISMAVGAVGLASFAHQANVHTDKNWLAYYSNTEKVWEGERYPAAESGEKQKDGPTLSQVQKDCAKYKKLIDADLAKHKSLWDETEAMKWGAGIVLFLGAPLFGRVDRKDYEPA